MDNKGDNWRWNTTKHRIPQSGYRIDVIDKPNPKLRTQPYGFAPPQVQRSPFPPQVAARQRI